MLMGYFRSYSRKSDPKNIDSSYKIVKIRDFQGEYNERVSHKMRLRMKFLKFVYNSSTSSYHSNCAFISLKIDDGGPLGGEGGSLALFSPSRFYLPGSLGPAWLTQSSTISTNITLEDLVDFQSKSLNKFHVTCQKCPLLIRNTLKELFPTVPEAASANEVTLLTLTSPTETEMSAKSVRILPISNLKNFLLTEPLPTFSLSSWPEKSAVD